MSEETIKVHTSLTAHDAASPAVKSFLGNIKKLDASLKTFNSQFANLGRTGAGSMVGMTRSTESLLASMKSAVNATKQSNQSITRDFKRANSERITDARRMFGQLEHLESNYRRQIERTAGVERRAERRSGMRGREFGSARMPAPRIRSLVFGGVAVTGGVAASFAQRMKVDAAETKAAMFGDLTSAEIKKLRTDFADRAGIRYGVGVTKAIETAVEGLKAGISKESAGAFGNLALKAQTGLDIDSAATAKLMGRITTLKGGFNQNYLGSVLNAVAVANNSTAADGNEIVEALRRSLSATVATRMSMQDLAAFDASAISIGIQPNKAGTFMSYITSEIANAKNARGQRAKDLSEAASKLGFGSRANLSAQMVSNPTQTLLTIFERLMKMPEAARAKIASLIGNREWRDELLSLASARDLIAKTITEIAAKPGFLDSAALKKIKSLNGRWASITAAMGLVVEKIGAGFESAFESISDTLIDIAASFNFDTIRDHVSALVDGLRQGFGLKNWGEAVTAIADMFNSGSLAKLKAFGKGLAEGLRETLSILKGAFTGLASLFGKGDAESMGKFTARLLGLTVALALIAPVVNVLGSISLFLLTIGAVAGGAAAGITALFVALSVGLKLSLGWVADRIFDAFRGIVEPIVGAIKSIATSVINKVRGWLGLSPIGDGGGASGSWNQRSGSAGASGSWSPPASATDFSGSRRRASGSIPSSADNSLAWSRRRVAAINTTPNIAPDLSGVTGGGLSRSAFDSTFKGTALEGKYDAIVASAKANGVPPDVFAAVIAHETGRGRNVRANNVAGLMNPDTGYRTKQGFATIDDGITAAARVVGKNYRLAGGDLGKMGQRFAPVGAANDPNGLNANWAKGVQSFRSQLSGGVAGAGYVGLGDPVSAAEQYIGKNEYTNRAELSQLVGHDVAGRANAWCARFVNTMLDKTGGKGTGSAIANSFLRYGQRVIDKASVARGDVLVQSNGRGVDQPGGHVGLATGKTRFKDGRLQLEMRSGNDGDSVRDSWRDASKLEVRRGLTSAVPTPADVIANVPPSNGAAARALLEKNNSALLGGAGGPVAININGSSHDPEALATLVQRRINEAMNWRLHDVDTAAT